MRIDFNILWIEDQPGNVQAQRDAIERRIRSEGFRLQTEFARSLEEAQDYLSSDVYGDHIDLILMDYDLGAGMKGDEGLQEVRKAFPFKDVIFYSARANDLARLVAEKQIQGIFCSERAELPNEVLGAFEALIKKVLDIDHARGIIMGTSSEIDGLIFDCLSAHCAKDEDALSEVALGIIESRLQEIRQRFEETAAAIAAARKVTELQNVHHVYTSIDRLNLLRKLLEPIGRYTAFCMDMKKYAVETVPQRNILAHVRVERNGFLRKLYDKKGNEITSENVRQLRLALLGYQEALEKLLQQLKES